MSTVPADEKPAASEKPAAKRATTKPAKDKPVATSGGKVHVRVLLDAAHSELGRFLPGREYEVDKQTAAWLLEDPRVAVPVKSAGTRETATEE